MTEKRDTAPEDGSSVEIIDLRRGSDDFAADVRTGLTSSPKTLSPRYFYDDLGSTLFDAICLIPEYYVARAEHEILRNRSDEIFNGLPTPIRLIELGSGTARKTRHLIDALLRRQSVLEYLPVDIDLGTLRTMAEALSAEYNNLRIRGIAASFEDGLASLATSNTEDERHTVALFLGSTIGNLEPEVQREILRSIRSALRAGDALLLGTDLVKSEDALLPAYDDGLGVTAAFNRNLLVRINRELDGTFNVAAFRHAALYDPLKQRIEMHLVSAAPQRAAVHAAGIEIDFAAGESIHTESSYKFTHETVDLLARESGFRLERQWTDQRVLFGENLLIAV